VRDVLMMITENNIVIVLYYQFINQLAYKTILGCERECHGDRVANNTDGDC
jgi:hypothetical protein